MHTENTPTGVTSGDDFTPRQRRHAIAAVTLGNGLEFYDFITYAFFAIQIGQTFFPSDSPYLSLMGSLAAFGAGFITRPLGAHFLGGFADRHGRKPAMLISMTMMGVGILLLVLSPGYAEIGLVAPALAVTARLIQGFALGGEVGSASIYMLESARTGSRGFTMSWQAASQSIAGATGALVGLGLSLILTEAQLAAFGWRIALGIGAAIVPLALIMRRTLPETHDVAVHAAAPRASIRPHLRTIWTAFVILAAGTMSSYVFIYMATYAQNTLKLPSSIAFAGEMANNMAQAIAVLGGGMLSDRIGRKPVMLGGQIAFIAMIMPCFWWLTSWGGGTTAFLFINTVLAAASACYFGALYAYVGESLPPSIRARVFALVYAVPIAVFGGTTQLQVTWLLEVTGKPVALGWYLAITALIGLVAILFTRESAPLAHRRSQTLVAPLPA